MPHQLWEFDIDHIEPSAAALFTRGVAVGFIVTAPNACEATFKGLEGDPAAIHQPLD